MIERTKFMQYWNFSLNAFDNFWRSEKKFHRNQMDWRYEKKRGYCRGTLKIHVPSNIPFLSATVLVKHLIVVRHFFAFKDIKREC